ncbi:MAG TPA: acetyl-CoA carboxylase biotin carboxyl carrier protein [candidate division WOR-3 bacterium]|uniref:Biotin carboxyl carrier protein of acetyl-CoA carboxylase n=1 Tax=candidate division WOR-3 bacterium TaxID=2052148 RepID=A0A9C9ELR3_UNCW3|nr:acetyl-CoA carboxylase biotin carboxyl carrier protein [candidate division WOR-3 bacterium]
MKIKNIEKLVKILENSVVSEIEITDLFGRTVRIRKSGNNTQITQTPAKKQPTAVSEPQTTEQEDKKNLVAIKSPIVGTFYRAPAPDAPPYVEIGDVVKPGQVVCIVEAMKLMNEIESDVAGKIVKILVKNEDPVEYNQELFLIEPL